jgi:hypothetical protein
MNDEIAGLLATWHGEIADDIHEAEQAQEAERVLLAAAEAADMLERRRIADLQAAFVAIVPKNGNPACLANRMRDALAPRNPGELVKRRITMETLQSRLDDLRVAEACLTRALVPPAPAPELEIVATRTGDFISPVVRYGIGF